MHILITGATGLIGSALCHQLSSKYSVTALVRNITQAKQRLTSRLTLINSLDNLAHLNHIDAVINLAGAPIFAHAWNTQYKQQLYSSRIPLTQKLSQLINQSTQLPSCFISASATGYYGDRKSELLTEQSSAGEGFSAQLCQQWEQAALMANTRVCLIRTGLVLSPQGGALQRMLPIYKWGLGGKLGSGEQYWSWISLIDAVNAIQFLLENPSCQGAFNLVAPCSITNQEFSHQLSRLLKRPNLAPLPSGLLTILLGERASLLLNSQNIQPQALLHAGFEFQYPELNGALNELFNGASAKGKNSS